MNELRCRRTDCALQYNVEGWRWGRCAAHTTDIDADGKCTSFVPREKVSE